ncbi:Early nodulin-75 like [Actinidia chinensis var. chinensis]|uniref:Early nodulin-75 like n=1 Tax=Actinidia chinensis var. chinensis TaxID=1590841 RepID=A0A2R6PKN8_ACTCC|nr:Early nodulin-75 like [Actinidia chinensis var. chinensis]
MSHLSYLLFLVPVVMAFTTTPTNANHHPPDESHSSQLKNHSKSPHPHEHNPPKQYPFSNGPKEEPPHEGKPTQHKPPSDHEPISHVQEGDLVGLHKQKPPLEHGKPPHKEMKSVTKEKPKKSLKKHKPPHKGHPPLRGVQYLAKAIHGPYKKPRMAEIMLPAYHNPNN